MPKLIPVADALSKPFWDAVNQKRLALQYCPACDRLQHPPQRGGQAWHWAPEPRSADQPYNLAMVTLDTDPRVNFYSNPPGTPPYQVPVGAAVAVIFEE